MTDHTSEKHPVAGILMLCLALLLSSQESFAETHLSIMSFNIWGGGLNDGKSTMPTVAAIRASGADIIGLQEVRGESVPCTGTYCPAAGESVAPRLAEALGFHYHEQTTQNDALWANAILSRFPIMETTPHDLGVRINVNGLVVYLFNIHPTDYPYQPYQLLDIPYDDAPFLSTAEKAVQSAEQTRSLAFQLLERDLALASDASLVAITGDFNEPSHLDWTTAAATAGLHPMAVPWPLSRAIVNKGFTDSYRAIYPDEVTHPGFTWSPLISAHTTDDHRDRIDFVYVAGRDITISGAAVMGENQANADIVINPWPSDHRAIVARVSIAEPD